MGSYAKVGHPKGFRRVFEKRLLLCREVASALLFAWPVGRMASSSTHLSSVLMAVLLCQ